MSFTEVSVLPREEINDGLDSLHIKLIKPSLGKQSWFDTDDFKHNFMPVIERVDNVSDKLRFEMLQHHLSTYKKEEEIQSMPDHPHKDLGSGESKRVTYMKGEMSMEDLGGVFGIEIRREELSEKELVEFSGLGPIHHEPSGMGSSKFLRMDSSYDELRGIESDLSCGKECKKHHISQSKVAPNTCLGGRVH